MDNKNITIKVCFVNYVQISCGGLRYNSGEILFQSICM